MLFVCCMSLETPKMIKATCRWKWHMYTHTNRYKPTVQVQLISNGSYRTTPPNPPPFPLYPKKTFACRYSNCWLFSRVSKQASSSFEAQDLGREQGKKNVRWEGEMVHRFFDFLHGRCVDVLLPATRQSIADFRLSSLINTSGRVPTRSFILCPPRPSPESASFVVPATTSSPTTYT